MKIDYEEFNRLQKQQKIRDYSEDVYNTLNCLKEYVRTVDKTHILEMMHYINSIKDEAIENVKKMIEGS